MHTSKKKLMKEEDKETKKERRMKRHSNEKELMKKKGEETKREKKMKRRSEEKEQMKKKRRDKNRMQKLMQLQESQTSAELFFLDPSLHAAVVIDNFLKMESQR